MLSKPLILGLNQLIKANYQTQSELKRLAHKIIQLKFLNLELNFIIDDSGLMSEETRGTDVQIKLPLNLISQINQNQLDLFRNLEITGDYELAKNFLNALAKIDYLNLIELDGNNSQTLGLIAYQTHKLINALIDVFKKLVHSLNYSFSQYLQYEINSLANSYQLEKFYTEVDELVFDVDRLNAKFQKL